jgi:hypothetical protein
MMRKLIFLMAACVLATNVGFTQSRSTDAAAQVRAGEVVPIGDSLFVKVSKTTKPFAGVKVKGEAVVVLLEMDAGKNGATLFYNISANPDASEVYLVSGAKKIAPLAVIEDFPSWGKDNDKEIDPLDPKETAGGTTLTFDQKGSISLLFDVPIEEAKTAKKLSVALRVVQPKDEKRSFVVVL